MTENEKQGDTTFAIIETGGKQYHVVPNRYVVIEKLDEGVGDTVHFDKVLLRNKGGAVEVGMPYVQNATVHGVVEDTGRGKKVDVLRFRAKSNYKKLYGHRQPFTKVRITSV